MCVYVLIKFKVFSTVLTSFRHSNFPLPPLPTSKQTPKKPNQIRVKFSCNFHLLTSFPLPSHLVFLFPSLVFSTAI